MATLHTVNKSPFEQLSLDSCLGFAKKGSSILLLEDGVYAAMQNQENTDKIIKSMESFAFYVLGPDVSARGLEQAKLIEGIKVVDYGGFVDLVTEHDNVQAWL